MRYLIIILLALSACTTKTPVLKVPEPKVETPVPQEVPMGLNWENTTELHPERIPWSKHLLKLSGEHLESFKKGTDWPKICPKWNSLNDEQKKYAIATMIVAVVYYESGYSTTNWMTETTMGTDPVTKKQVKSEGLLQLSYQDKEWAPWCQFDWSKDKLLSQNDPKKTIFDPYINLSCGVRIMANQVVKKGLVFPSKGYWAVMNTSSKYGHVSDIKARVLKYAGACK